MSDEANNPARPRAKTREGVVVSNKMDKTAVVSVARRVRHGKYMKTVVRHKHYMVHDENNDCRPGDRVVIAEYWTLDTLFPPAQATTGWTENTENPGEYIQNGHAVVAS
ncbi:MAG: 30S ribosomal protein S17, partial [Candidatus Binatia bacterium]